MMANDAPEDILYRLFTGCRVCGTGKQRYRTTSSYGIPTCRDCFNLPDDIGEIGYIFEHVEGIKNLQERDFTFSQLVREHYRARRIKHGVIDPEISCISCHEKKSIFEFPIQWTGSIEINFNNLKCYSCIFTAQHSKYCWVCDQVRLEDEWNDPGDACCALCMKEKNWFNKLHDRLRLKKKELASLRYSDKQCIANLLSRGIKNPSGEQIEIIRKLVLMKRVRKKLNKWRKEYESNSSNV